jgi:hypothetical protein
VTIAEPILDLQWGKGNWQDYISNWRTRDTNWMQERLILRYETTAKRTTDWPAPQTGQVTFNGETGLLEMWSQAKNAWLRSLMFQNLLSNKDDAVGVNMFHTASGGKGLQLGPTSLLIDAPTTNFLNGVHTVDATGMTLKVGAKTAKLSTDATALVSDSPIKAPSLDIAGAVGVGALTAASLSVPTATVTTSLTLTGATVTGGTLNAAGGTIGGVGIGSNIVTTPAGSATANAAGLQSGQGYFYGDSGGAVMRQRANAGSVPGAANVSVVATDVGIDGTAIHLWGQTRIENNRPLQYVTTAGVKNGGPVIWGADPGVANVPEGTIWGS